MRGSGGFPAAARGADATQSASDRRRPARGSSLQRTADPRMVRPIGRPPMLNPQGRLRGCLKSITSICRESAVPRNPRVPDNHYSTDMSAAAWALLAPLLHVAGAGNGFTVWLLRHSQRKRGETDRPDLRNTALVL